jgi:hypothetical protein
LAAQLPYAFVTVDSDEPHITSGVSRMLCV